jgi:DNA-binding response OmpR family regulator
VARILLIDDEKQFRQALRQVLEKAGYEVVEARNGQEGLQCYRNAPADLVIMDLIMPEMEGIETIMELRREFEDLKIIAVSGGDRYLLDAARHLGAQHIFQKPFAMNELLDAVQKLLIIS